MKLSNVYRSPSRCRFLKITGVENKIVLVTETAAGVARE